MSGLSRFRNPLDGLSLDCVIPEAFYTAKQEALPKGSKAQIKGLVLACAAVSLAAFVALFLQSSRHVTWNTVSTIQTSANATELAYRGVDVDYCDALLRVSSDTYTEIQSNYINAPVKKMRVVARSVLGTAESLSGSLEFLSACAQLAAVPYATWVGATWTVCGDLVAGNVQTGTAAFDTSVSCPALSTPMITISLPLSGAVSVSNDLSTKNTLTSLPSGYSFNKLLAAGDIDGDGQTDFISGYTACDYFVYGSQSGSSSCPTKLQLMLSQFFLAGTTIISDLFTSPGYIGAGAVADIDNDGNLDFVYGVVTSTSAMTAPVHTVAVEWLKGLGGWKFESSPRSAGVLPIATASYTYAVAVFQLVVFDFDQDNNLDVVVLVAGADTSGNIYGSSKFPTYVVRGTGGGLFNPPETIANFSWVADVCVTVQSPYIIPVQFPKAMFDSIILHAEDVDQDGLMDIVVGSQWARNLGGGSPTSSWPVSDLSPAVTALTGDAMYSSNFADLNYDGVNDLIFSPAGNMCYFIAGLASGGYAADATFVGWSQCSVLMDVDGSSTLDILPRAGSCPMFNIGTTIAEDSACTQYITCPVGTSVSIGNMLHIPASAGWMNPLVYICDSNTSASVTHVWNAGGNLAPSVQWIEDGCETALSEAFVIFNNSPPYACTKMVGTKPTIFTSLSVAFANTQIVFSVLLVLAVLLIERWNRDSDANKRVKEIVRRKSQITVPPASTSNGEDSAVPRSPLPKLKSVRNAKTFVDTDEGKTPATTPKHES